MTQRHPPAPRVLSAIREELTKRGLQCVPLHIDKILQLFDTFNVRFGVVITGPTTAGKTTAYKVCASVLVTTVQRLLFVLIVAMCSHAWLRFGRHLTPCGAGAGKRHVGPA
jgi:hypothetical protein